MDHVAIMNKSWRLIPKILSGQKTIESRWYQTKRAPWGQIKTGDQIFFKNSGEPITAEAEVGEVLEFEIRNLSDVIKIVKDYGKDISLVNSDPTTWGKLAKYCILVRLKNSRIVEPAFEINKKGFGIGAAWLVTENIETIKK